MDFAENNRISHRQLYRQIILAFGAPFLLCLFGREQLLGMTGAAGMAAALIALGFYVIFLIRLTPFYADLLKTTGTFWGRMIGIFFLFYILFTGAYLLSVLEEIVPASLLTGVPGKWISFFAIVSCSLGTHKGMQKRGRMAEVSGALFLGGVLLMMALCLGQSRFSYLQEMWTEAVPGQGSFFESVYRALCAFSGIGFLPFALGHVEKQGRAGRPILWGLLTLGWIVIGMLFLLPAVFGWKRLLEEPRPILPLLAGADLPGNVLARFDVLWMGFLLYSLLFSIGSLLYYGHEVIRRTRLGTGKYWMAAVIYGLSVLEPGGVGIEDFYQQYLGWIFVPGLLLLQIFLLMRGRGRRKKAVLMSAVLGMTLFLGGCAGVEPEKRLYPLALGIDTGQEGIAVTYGMPDLPEATGQEKPEEGGSERALTISGSDFNEIEAIYNRSQEKYLDMGHLQVLILGNNLIETKKWDAVLRYLKQEPFVGENVYVFRTDDTKKLLEWSGTGGSSIGEYLTGLLENRTAGQQKNGVTLRQIYYQWYDDGGLLPLPLVTLENDKIQVMLE